MTTEEFSNEFDTLLNSYSALNKFDNNSPINTIELDEYEKSVLLTKAQEELVISLYNGKNPYNDSFEKTEEVRRYLNNLIKTDNITDKVEGYEGLSELSVFFELKEEPWFITYESATLDDTNSGCLNGKEISITPISQDDYFRISNNPFRGPNKRRALRLDGSGKVVEIISEYNIGKYLVRYIVKPKPIILINLPDNLTINGESKRTECELNPVIHRAILEKAVTLAVSSRVPNAGKQQ